MAKSENEFGAEPRGAAKHKGAKGQSYKRKDKTRSKLKLRQ